MRKVVSEKLTNEVAEWGHRGLIAADLCEKIGQRYASDVTAGRLFLRWLGFFGVFLLGASILGFLGLALGEVTRYLAPFVLGGLAYFMWLKGVQMATDPEQRYPMSGAVLVTVGLIAAFGAAIALFALPGDRIGAETVAVVMLLVAGAGFFTAYRYGLRWPLTLAVLLVFHGIGLFHWYGGRGSYFMGIRDERLTLVVAIASILFGMWHEKTLEREQHRREIGFGQVYIVWGLLYANMSLWYLSIPREGLLEVVLFTAACIAQLVLGGRFHDGRFMGFGIVFLSINLYTRMFEHFWNELSKGSFFLISGAIALAAGLLLERRARSARAGA